MSAFKILLNPWIVLLDLLNMPLELLKNPHTGDLVTHLCSALPCVGVNSGFINPNNF